MGASLARISSFHGISGGNAMKLPDRRHFLHLAAGAAALPAMSRIARAQTYPTRPIRLVIPFPPGGTTDAIGRPWADRVKGFLGTVVVENQGGAGGSTGTAAVARARPDGYTILLGNTSVLVVNPAASSRSLYDPIKDFMPIAILGTNPSSIAVHPTQPIRTLNELVAYAKSNPGKLSYGSSGVGTLNHLVGERLKLLTGTNIAHIPYRGAGPAMADLISGHIPMLVHGINGQAIELHRTGKVRILAVTGATRLAGAPDIPAVAEAGFPDMFSHYFTGLFAPKGTPKMIVDELAEATRKAISDQELQRVFTNSGIEPDLDASPQKAQRLLEDEIARWTPVIKAIGLRLD
jgi:tripartite-type tricarboxylate transporter receptor subunit TctC